MRVSSTAVGPRAWLVKIEILAVLLLNFALIFLGLLSWIGFAAVAVETGMFTEQPGSPFAVGHVPSLEDRVVERGFTPVGYLLWASAVGLPAAFLLGLAILLHRLVVRPLADRGTSGRG